MVLDIDLKINSQKNMAVQNYAHSQFSLLCLAEHDSFTFDKKKETSEKCVKVLKF